MDTISLLPVVDLSHAMDLEQKITKIGQTKYTTDTYVNILKNNPLVANYIKLY